MLYCKLAGMICVLGACIWMGLELERGLRRRWLFVQEMKETLDFLEKEMICHRTPIPEALQEAAKRCRSGAERVLAEAAEGVKERRGLSFTGIWEMAVRKETARLGLADPERELTEEVADALCNTDTVMQKALLEKYRGRFERMSRELEQTYREKGALYRKLSAAAGAFLALLLL